MGKKDSKSQYQIWERVEEREKEGVKSGASMLLPNLTEVYAPFVYGCEY